MVGAAIRLNKAPSAKRFLCDSPYTTFVYYPISGREVAMENSLFITDMYE